MICGFGFWVLGLCVLCLCSVVKMARCDGLTDDDLLLRALLSKYFREIQEEKPYPRENSYEVLSLYHHDDVRFYAGCIETLQNMREVMSI